MSPYRSPIERLDDQNPERDGGYVGSDLVVGFLLWSVSLVRVVLGIAHHETFGAEGTLAVLGVLLIPLLLLKKPLGRAGGR